MATSQEDFWSGEFGAAYVDRNNLRGSLSSRIALFSRILARTEGVKSIYECGSNVGLNLVALHQLMPAASLYAIEINAKAFAEVSGLPFVEARHGSFLTSKPRPADLVFTSGVLIHINPDSLKDAYRHLYDSAAKYVCVIRYYNPTPVAIDYRDHADKLFKRDFAGELMEAYPLTLVDYGFVPTGGVLSRWMT